MQPASINRKKKGRSLTISHSLHRTMLGKSQKIYLTYLWEVRVNLFVRIGIMFNTVKSRFARLS